MASKWTGNSKWTGKIWACRGCRNIYVLDFVQAVGPRCPFCNEVTTRQLRSRKASGYMMYRWQHGAGSARQAKHSNKQGPLRGGW